MSIVKENVFLVCVLSFQNELPRKEIEQINGYMTKVYRLDAVIFLGGVSPSSESKETH